MQFNYKKLLADSIVPKNLLISLCKGTQMVCVCQLICLLFSLYQTWKLSFNNNTASKCITWQNDWLGFNTVRLSVVKMMSRYGVLFWKCRELPFCRRTKNWKKPTILFCLKVLGHAFLGAKYEVEFSMQRHWTSQVRMQLLYCVRTVLCHSFVEIGRLLK